MSAPLTWEEIEAICEETGYLRILAALDAGEAMAAALKTTLDELAARGIHYEWGREALAAWRQGVAPRP